MQSPEKLRELFFQQLPDPLDKAFSITWRMDQHMLYSKVHFESSSVLNSCCSCVFWRGSHKEFPLTETEVQNIY